MMIVIAAIMKVIANNITEMIAANIIQVRGGTFGWGPLQRGLPPPPIP